jgi:signal transduction histidine kinase
VIAQLARTLGIPVTRRAVAADREHDIELSVRAVPEGEEVALTIAGWVARPAAGPRLMTLLAPEAHAPEAPAAFDWSTDAELRLTTLSDDLAKLLEVEPCEAIGQPLTRLFRLEEDGDGEMPLISALASRRAFSGQPARGRQSGAAPRFLLSADVLNASDPGFTGFSGHAAPLDPMPGTEQPPANAPLEQFDDVLDEALRTPIDRIIESAERIAGRSDGPLRSDYADYATDISAAARHLLSVIQSMGEQQAQEQAVVDLARLAADAVVMFESMAEERGVTIVMEASRALPANGEERSVIQILVNLIGNAVRHSPNGSTVTLRFRRSAEESCVTVLDQGPGIDPADQQRIFERFERAQTGEGGTGLGLAISRRLARSMGGDIELESAPNAGARFTLRLPSA